MGGVGVLQGEAVCPVILMLRERDKKIVEEAVEMALPNITYLSEFLECVEKDLEESETLSDFLTRLERRISSAKDETERTDFVILRNHLTAMMSDIT